MTYETQQEAADAIGQAHHNALFMRNRCLIAMRALDANLHAVTEEAYQTRHGVIDMLEQLHADLDELTTILDGAGTTLGMERLSQIDSEARS